MNDLRHKEMVREAVSPKFRGRNALKCKTSPRFPESSEREMKRIINSYLRVMTDALRKRLPALLVTRRTKTDSRFDDFRGQDETVRQVFLEIALEIEQKFKGINLEPLLRFAANRTKSISLREWRRAVKETLGIDLMTSYYDGGFFEEYIRRWVGENVLKITSIPTQTLGEMQQIILDGFRRGLPVRDIQKEIQRQYNVTRAKARLIARDQISTLNAQITQAQQRDAGVTKYVWSSSRDSRVRECHAELDGKVFSWDEPPDMWYNTKSRGMVFTGRRCHPGEDYACRCCALPVFELDTISVPMGEQEDG